MGVSRVRIVFRLQIGHLTGATAVKVSTFHDFFTHFPSVGKKTKRLISAAFRCIPCIDITAFGNGAEGYRRDFASMYVID
jgi:hypothetical protein